MMIALMVVCRGMVSRRLPCVMIVCFPLACDVEADLCKNAQGLRMADAGQLRHRSNCDRGFFDVQALRPLGVAREPLADPISDVFESFLSGGPFRMTAWQSRTTY